MHLQAYFLGILLVQPVVVLADATPNDAHVWLAKMAEAVQRLNYDGTFIYWHDDQLETVRIVHQSDSQGERERLVSLTGAAREIIKSGEELTCYLPDQKSVMVSKSHPRKPYSLNLPKDISRLTKNYKVTLSHTERMAGNDSQIVTIMPRDGFRYGYRLWLDNQNGMPLKSDLLDEHGTAVEQVMFTNIEFLKQIPPELLQPTLSGSGYVWHNDVDAAGEVLVVDKSAWSVTRLPDGFMLTHHSQHPMPDSKAPTEHMVFSDALASLSVYIDQAGDDKRMLNGMSHMGAVNAYGTIVSGHHVTVVGDVPRATVQMVGESLRYQSESPQ